MPHLRERFILKIIESKLKFAPVFALQGARQTGKSFLAREIVAKGIQNSIYFTFDQKAIRTFASKRPDTFIEDNLSYKPIIIDEAQKVPDIFDAIKFRVDKKRIPGQFFILGSTEFSKLSNIRESLTGRMSRAKLYPLTIRETLSKKINNKSDDFYLCKNAQITRAEFLRYLKSGGMPGIFTVKNIKEKELLLKDWISLTVERDIHTFERFALSSELTFEILENIAKLDEPSLANIVKAVRTETRKVKLHLQVLETLFVINPLPAHKSGSGKTIYYILDCALAKILGADFERLICTTVLNELLAKISYFDDSFSKLSYYRNTKGKRVDFLLENKDGSIALLKVIPDEKYDERNLEILIAYKKKTNANVRLYAIGPYEGIGSREKIKVYNWESIA